MVSSTPQWKMSPPLSPSPRLELPGLRARHGCRWQRWRTRMHHPVETGSICVHWIPPAHPHGSRQPFNAPAPSGQVETHARDDVTPVSDPSSFVALKSYQWIAPRWWVILPLRSWEQARHGWPAVSRRRQLDFPVEDIQGLPPHLPPDVRRVQRRTNVPEVLFRFR